MNAPAELGLTLEDGKTILNGIEQDIISDAGGYPKRALSRMHPLPGAPAGQRYAKASARHCLWACHGALSTLHSLHVPGRKGQESLAASPLGRARDEALPYLLAEWGSKLPYRKAAELLQEFLPASNARLSHTSVRRQTLSVGALLDQRVTEPEEYDCLEPCRQAVRAGDRLTIAIDGTYVRSDLTNGLYQHYVVAGRVERDGDLGGHFAWVAQRPDDAVSFPRRCPFLP